MGKAGKTFSEWKKSKVQRREAKKVCEVIKMHVVSSLSWFRVLLDVCPFIKSFILELWFLFTQAVVAIGKVLKMLVNIYCIITTCKNCAKPFIYVNYLILCKLATLWGRYYWPILQIKKLRSKKLTNGFIKLPYLSTKYIKYIKWYLKTD